MSWKHSGQLVGGPPSSSLSSKGPIAPVFRNNLNGQTAYQREQAMLARYGPLHKGKEREIVGKTEWDILRENHRFIREDEEPDSVSWEERLARAYESKLFKEFALIDLKHYKSKRLALRWRTAPEVVAGIGEDTCASLRCKYHHCPSPSDEHLSTGRKRKRDRPPELRAFELPFVYEEAGARKEALVKVKLCSKCQAKLLWKPDLEKVTDGKEKGSSDEEEERRERVGKKSDRKSREKSRSRSRSPVRRRRGRDDD